MSELGNVSYEIASAIAFVFFNMTSRKESHEVLYNNALVEDIRTVLKDLFFLAGSIHFLCSKSTLVHLYIRHWSMLPSLHEGTDAGCGSVYVPRQTAPLYRASAWAFGVI